MKLNGINSLLESIFDNPTVKAHNRIFYSKESWAISFAIVMALNIFAQL
jgi:hypothetical protein